MNETTKNYEGLIDFEVTYVSEEEVIGRMPVQAKGMTGLSLAINLSNYRESELIAKARYVKKGRSVSTVRTIVESEQSKLLLDVTTFHVAS